jgi:DNA polymerase III delta prime subunit
MLKDEQRMWEFKYAPQTLNEMVLSDELRPKLEKTIKEVPNLLLYGSAGVGKSTFTKVFLNETGLDYMWVNASDKTGIDYVRDDIKAFAYAGGADLKVVVLNEADSMSKGPQGAQKMLKQLSEDVETICRFILITNEIWNIISPLRSRCIEIPFDNPPVKDIGLHVSRILKAEKVKYTPKILANIIKKCYPDIRKTIWVLQENSIDGELKESTIYSPEELFADIFQKMLKRDFDGIRTILRSNYINYVYLYELLYTKWTEFKSPGEAIILIGEHLRDNNEVPNKEINFMKMAMMMAKGNVI